MSGERPEHSPLGGSGAPRWMKCPGSVQLGYGIQDKESEYAELGTRAHALAEHCLIDDTDAWEYIGPLASTYISYGKVYKSVDKDMADAVQVYLNAIRSAHPDRNQANAWVEREFYCSILQPYFWGKADFVYYDLVKTIHVWDYKHGAGIVVDAKDNAQLMYYACGVLEDLLLWDTVETVVLHIAQPRGFHWDGPIRSWTISADDLNLWMYTKLLPAMERALVSSDTESGEHCRFCPARGRACPQIIKDYEELDAMIKLSKKKSAKALTNIQIGRFKDLYQIAKIADKAHTETAFARMTVGKEIPGWKLGKARANRGWKRDAEDVLKKHFGKKAYTEPELKSPSKIEELPEGKKYTTRYAFKPNKGMTVLKASDPRPATNVNLKSLFKARKK